MSSKMDCELGLVKTCGSCERNGSSYEYGSGLIEGAKIFECSDGNWIETIYPFIGTGP